MLFLNPCSKILFLLVGIATALHCDPPASTAVSPLKKLVEGNQRFASGKAIHPDESMKRVVALASGQRPFCTVISCSDSRVSPEIIFDRGLGDIFSVRTAGNIIGDYELGSVEYSVEHLKSNLIIVLGHRDCGAIKTFISTKGHYRQADHIKSIVDYIQAEDEEKQVFSSQENMLQRATEANVMHGVHCLKSADPILKAAFERKEIKIVGAVYDVQTAKVVILHDL